MMSKRLFVGNLVATMSDRELANVFAPYGTIRKAEVVRGRGGKGRGFGYVELASDEDALRAIAELNGSQVLGHTVTLAEAQSAAPRSRLAEPDYRAEFSRGRDRGDYRSTRR
jgi:RNA recognition motif-containing protein